MIQQAVPGAVERAGRRSFPGFSYRVVARTSSTQDIARRAARAEAPSGWCCVADEQTAGRGRQGRPWVAPPGGALLMSLVLRPRVLAPGVITLGAGVAVADALATFGVEVALRWPNDVMAGGGKLSGVLAEVETGRGGPAVVVGIGLNLRVDAFPPGVAGSSLHRLTEGAPDRDAVLERLLAALAHRFDQAEAGRAEEVIAAWRERAAGLGGAVLAETPGGPLRGVARDVDAEGALLLETPDGTIRLVAADVHLLGASRPGG